MNASKVRDLLNKIEMVAQQIEGTNREMADYAGHIRKFVAELRDEVIVPADENLLD